MDRESQDAGEVLQVTWDQITNALHISENGVMFEKSESADDNSSSNGCDFKGIIWSVENPYCPAVSLSK